MNTKSEKFTRRGSKHAQPELRAQQIIMAAIECFGENGYDNTTIDAIGKLAGLSKGTVYRFFSSKDDLLLSVIDHLDHLFEQRFKEQSQGKSSVDKLEIFCQISVTDIIEEQELLSLWFQVLNLSFIREKLRVISQKDIATVAAIVREGIEKGELKAETIDYIPTTLVALLHGHYLLSHLGKETPADSSEKFNHSWQLIKEQIIKR